MIDYCGCAVTPCSAYDYAAIKHHRKNARLNFADSAVRVSACPSSVVRFHG